MAWAVRAAMSSDLPAVLTLYRELHPGDPTVPAAAAEGTWSRILAQAGRTVLVVDDGSHVVGTAEITVVENLTRGGHPYALVEDVVVAASSRRTGVGLALLAEVVAIAKRAGCYKVQLASGSGEATEFYVACGFRPSGPTLKLPLHQAAGAPAANPAPGATL